VKRGVRVKERHEMSSELRYPELQQLDRAVAAGVRRSSKRFWIGCAIGGVIGFLLPALDFLIQFFLLDLGPLNIILFAIIGGVWAVLTKPKEERMPTHEQHAGRYR